MLRYFFPSFFALSSLLSINAQFSPDTILILHPTISSIETISYLYEENILSSKEGAFHFLGVYHENENYDYNKSDSFLLAHPDVPFSLHQIHGKQSIKTLFRQNNCTDDFLALFTKSIGAIFLGGPDLHPGIYGEKMHLLTKVSDPERHFMEASFVFHLLGGRQNNQWNAMLEGHPDYMILGICLGMQTINVGTGGTMIQDIPTEIYQQKSREEVLEQAAISHRNYYFDEPNDSIDICSYHFHHVIFSENNLFTKHIKGLDKQRPYVFSSHHQAIEKKGRDIEAIASSSDGKVIEAITHKQYKSVLGVQFHPEHTGLYNENLKYYMEKDSSINLNSFLIDQNSYQFHIEFWKLIGNLLENSAETTPSQQN